MSDSNPNKPQPPSNELSRWSYVLRCIGVVTLSILLPLALALTAIVVEIRDKGAHSLPSKYSPNFSGMVEQDEMWLAELQGDPNYRPLLTWLVPPLPDEVRLLKVNLITGTKTDTGLLVPNEHGEVRRLNETMYYVTYTSIFRQSGNQFVKLVDIPRGQNYYASLFKYQNQLTTIRQLDDGNHRLIHLVDDKWVDGRPILLPDQNRVWYDDAQRQRKSLLPLTSEQPASGPAFGRHI